MPILVAGGGWGGAQEGRTLRAWIRPGCEYGYDRLRGCGHGCDRSRDGLCLFLSESKLGNICFYRQKVANLFFSLGFEQSL